MDGAANLVWPAPCQQLFDVSQDMLCLVRQGMIVSVNAMLACRLGGGGANWRGQPLASLVHPDFRPIFSQHFDLLVEAPALIKLQGAAGEDMDVEALALVLGDDSGDGTVLVSFRDVGEKMSIAAEIVQRERRLARLLDISSDMIALVDDGQVVFVNQSGLRLLGADSLIQVMNRPLKALLDGVYAEVLSDQLPALADETQAVPVKFRRFDGRAVDVELTVKRFDDGDAGVFVLDGRDVTALHRSAASLLEREGRLRHILDSIADGIVVADQDGCIGMANPAAQRIFGWTDDRFGILGQILPGIPAPTDPGFGDPLEMIARTTGGTPVPVEISQALHAHGTERMQIIVIRDIRERKQAEQRLRHQATHDGLTDLPNRQLFLERLELAIHNSSRRDRLGAMLLVDVEGIKLINDSLGYAIGDKVLVAVAERLSVLLNRENFLARIGGDEFAVLLPELSADYEAAIEARRLVDAIEQPIMVDGFETTVSAVIGIVIYPRDGGDAGTLFRNSGGAVNRAKELGKGGIAFFTADINQVMNERMLLRNGLVRASENNEFHLVYQPKVDIRSGRISGVEALLRWGHADAGVPPAKFIPVLEETTLIGPVGRWVLESACLQQREWLDRGYDWMRTAVNLSVRQVRSGLVPMVETVLADIGLSPEHLEIEITESLLLTDTEASITMLKELSALGIQLAIDDFGTGYSSLSYLKRLPLHTIKIDRSFIQDMEEDVDAAEIVRTIVGMARSLRRRTVAEGVETKGQLAMLREFGCDEIQGYLFSPPVTGDEITRLLAEEAHRHGQRGRAL
ncbi:MAG: PAS domain S-box/diguanylate cyclase (GGDEF) domain-containing [Rhodospirillaceae bacterium]|nr:MAG: PAS domain S-box/diguanylate cyclase (GGDEF) domain-containing [Rhodospirillaceae bacterium]TNC96428.1 MAG: PAS domain S-box/diguanylate cyclase (GGDEF) domain-containing protein [Stygiobacter sp.]